MFRTGDDFTFSEFRPSEKEYKIQPYDKLSINITTNAGYQLIGIGESRNLGNREIEYLVEFDGLVKVPTLGRIPIEGLTIREAESMLEEKYSKYYQNPFVFIKVTNRKVIIFKDGGTTGSVINIPEENFTIVEALAMSGGLSNISKSYRIRLIRGELSENPEVFIYDLYDLKKLQEQNIYLEANDIIYIESKPRYVSKVLTEINPYLSLISTVLLVVSLFTIK